MPRGDDVHAAQRQPRQDPRRRRGGRRRAAPRRGRGCAPRRRGRRRGLRPQVRAAARRRSASPARPARWSEVPDRRRRSTPRCWCSSASARSRPTPSPYAGPPVSPPAAVANAASVALALPPTRPSWSGAVDRGLPCSAATRSRVQDRTPKTDRARRRRRAQRRSRASQDGDRGARGARRSSPPPSPRPRLGQHAAERPAPRRCSPTPSSARARSSPRAAARPRSTVEVLDDERARRARAAAASSASATARRARRGWSS